LYLSGYRSWFNLEDIAKINERNEQFRDQSYEEELIIRFFKFPEAKKVVAVVVILVNGCQAPMLLIF